MANIYQSFIWWLALWLPEDAALRFHLSESIYEGIEFNFWESMTSYHVSVSRVKVPRFTPDSLDDIPF